MQDNLLDVLETQWLEEEDLPDSSSQDTQVYYVRSVLKWHYRQEDWYIPGNFLLIRSGFGQAAPDVAVLKGYTNQQKDKERPQSWRIDPPRRPAPAVVIEISSKETWEKDLLEKVILYGQLGISEYFAFDADTPRNWVGRTERLLGWKYQNGQPQAIAPDSRGWLWSLELDSWMVADNNFLRLLDKYGQPRPAEWEVIEATQSELDTLRAKLKEMGIDPDAL